MDFLKLFFKRLLLPILVLGIFVFGLLVVLVYAITSAIAIVTGVPFH